ncbi:hypothetical protein [Tunturiibacter psychrotolerans]
MLFFFLFAILRPGQDAKMFVAEIGSKLSSQGSAIITMFGGVYE